MYIEKKSYWLHSWHTVLRSAKAEYTEKSTQYILLLFFVRHRCASDSIKKYSDTRPLLEDITLPYSLLTSIKKNQIDIVCYKSSLSIMQASD